jgi:hypothetical protein
VEGEGLKDKAEGIRNWELGRKDIIFPDGLAQSSSLNVLQTK